MKYTLPVFSILLALAACQSSPAPSKKADPPKVAQTSTHVPAKTSVPDQHLITRPCAIIYFMGGKKVEALKKEEGDNYEDAIDDAMYYSSVSRDTLKTTGVQVIDTSGEKLFFKLADGSVYQLDLHSRDHVAEIYLFNGKTRPVQGDLVDIMPDYQQVMKGQ